MKRIYLIFSLVLCLALCVFCFASCGKRNKSEVTATAPEQTTATQTTAAGTTADAPEPTEPAHVHVPDATPTIDLDPTCTEPGIQVYYCSEC